jgi:hypothetical protein
MIDELKLQTDDEHEYKIGFRSGYADENKDWSGDESWSEACKRGLNRGTPGTWKGIGMVAGPPTRDSCEFFPKLNRQFAYQGVCRCRRNNSRWPASF